MVSIIQFMLPYNYMNYVMFGIGDDAPHHSLFDWCCVCCSGTEHHYLVLFHHGDYLFYWHF